MNDYAMLGSDNLLEGPSVLVVDDDELTQELLLEMLSDLGLKKVQTAKDGREALKLLARMQQPPKFLLCDIFMPEMDGFEFLEKLAAQHFGGGIVMMTGVDPDMLRIARDIAVVNGLKVCGTFLKPVSMAQLSGALAE